MNGMWDKGGIFQSLDFALITLVKISHARKIIGNGEETVALSDQ